MEVDKKKRVTTREEDYEEEEERAKLKKTKAEEGVASGSGTVETPTEEEVDEFFAILRRMKVAVNYFHRKGSGATQWREVLERADHSLDHADHRQPPVKKNTNEGLDLNAVAPESLDGGDE
ncbi:hypothetical protein VNO77_00216 [Canavalia gladiata]|uniref:Uncharacterized protein n=1 Tax=Canavalia gladiata TaxID=3824 RepID=A0AAN9MP71_CANGL